MNSHERTPTERTRDTAQTGMFAMMAMMAVCCIAVLALVALIPLLGWPVGVVTAVAVGAAMMYAHMKFMNHGAHH